MNGSTFGITPNATLEKILLSTEGVLTFTCRLDVGDGIAGDTIAGADIKYWSSVGDRVRYIYVNKNSFILIANDRPFLLRKIGFQSRILKELLDAERRKANQEQ